MFNKEKTYPFSIEGLAIAKSDKPVINFIEKHHTSIDILAFSVGLVALYAALTPLSVVVAYKTISLEQTAEVAFKLVTTGL